MTTSSKVNKKVVQELNTELKTLEEQLVVAKQREGVDDYILVKSKKDQSRFKRVKVEEGKDKAFGQFLFIVNITAKKDTVYIPVSIASSQKPTGFMYYIEGTAAGSVVNGDVSVRGEGVTQTTIGTLVYATIPKGKTATFRLNITTRGQLGKEYKVIINRINYKLSLTDSRYQQYLKPIVSDPVKFSN